MDQMLHRGKYKIKTPGDEDEKPETVRSRFISMVGIDDNFTRGDRILAWSVVVWSVFWFVLFMVITIWNLFDRWPVKWWATYWHWEVVIVPLLIMVLTTIWFWWGGVHDLIQLFKRLNEIKSNPKDDGMVVGHRNLDDVETDTNDAENSNH